LGRGIPTLPAPCVPVRRCRQTSTGSPSTLTPPEGLFRGRLEKLHCRRGGRGNGPKTPSLTHPQLDWARGFEKAFLYYSHRSQRIPFQEMKILIPSFGKLFSSRDQARRSSTMTVFFPLRPPIAKERRVIVGKAFGKGNRRAFPLGQPFFQVGAGPHPSAEPFGHRPQ